MFVLFENCENATGGKQVKQTSKQKKEEGYRWNIQTLLARNVFAFLI